MAVYVNVRYNVYEKLLFIQVHVGHCSAHATDDGASTRDLHPVQVVSVSREIPTY